MSEEQPPSSTEAVQYETSNSQPEQDVQQQQEDVTELPLQVQEDNMQLPLENEFNSMPNQNQEQIQGDYNQDYQQQQNHEQDQGYYNQDYAAQQQQQIYDESSQPPVENLHDHFEEPVFEDQATQTGPTEAGVMDETIVHYIEYLKFFVSFYAKPISNRDFEF